MSPGIAESGSAKIMSEIDALSPDWRALVHEFGLLMVRAIRNEWGEQGIEMCRFQLDAWRARRQVEWLATNYVTRRSAPRLFRLAA
jgi:hypothetical protein